MINILQVIVVGRLVALRRWKGRFVIEEEGHTIVVGGVFVVNLGFDGLDSVRWVVDELCRVIAQSIPIFHLSLISRLSIVLDIISIRVLMMLVIIV